MFPATIHWFITGMHLDLDWHKLTKQNNSINTSVEVHLSQNPNAQISAQPLRWTANRFCPTPPSFFIIIIFFPFLFFCIADALFTPWVWARNFRIPGLRKRPKVNLPSFQLKTFDVWSNAWWQEVTNRPFGEREFVGQTRVERRLPRAELSEGQPGGEDIECIAYASFTGGYHDVCIPQTTACNQ